MAEHRLTAPAKRAIGHLRPTTVTVLLLAILAGSALAQSPETNAASELYRYRLLQIGTKMRSYPADAIAQGLEGTATVDLVIGANGIPTRISLVSSSGHPILDRHGLDLLARAVPLTEIPAALHNRAFALRVVLVFTLP